MHAVDPAGAKVPAPHVTHPLDAAYDPAAHAVEGEAELHAVAPVLPPVVLPLGHAMQSDAPTGENVSTGQGRHATPLGEYVPARHGLQPPLLSTAVPAAHFFV